MDRKTFLRGLSLAGIGSLLPTRKAAAAPALNRFRKPVIGAVRQPDIEKFFTRYPDGCILIPSETAGPFPLYSVYTNPNMVRSDVTEGLPGLPLYLELTVVNINVDCMPIENARVYIWHCDKDGNYSGYNANQGTTFMRGIQFTNASGVAGFTTIYPGWYPGRITHIHLQIYVSDVLAITTQLAFDNTITESVYADNPAIYTHGPNTTVDGNPDDNIFSDMQNTVLEIVNLTPVMDGETVIAYNGTLCIGVAGCVPPTPEITGDPAICIGDIQTYMVPYTPGHTYQWIVLGGQILSGQGTNAITVQWVHTGGGNIQVTESY